MIKIDIFLPEKSSDLLYPPGRVPLQFLLQGLSLLLVVLDVQFGLDIALHSSQSDIHLSILRVDLEFLLFSEVVVRYAPVSPVGVTHPLISAKGATANFIMCLGQTSIDKFIPQDRVFMVDPVPLYLHFPLLVNFLISDMQGHKTSLLHIPALLPSTNLPLFLVNSVQSPNMVLTGGLQLQLFQQMTLVDFIHHRLLHLILLINFIIIV